MLNDSTQFIRGDLSKAIFQSLVIKKYLKKTFRIRKIFNGTIDGTMGNNFIQKAA